MRCNICKGIIEPLLNHKGEVAWEGGHNPWPLTTDNEGNPLPDNARCCDTCNGDALYARITGKEPYDNRTLIKRRSASGVSSTQSNRELS